MTLFTLIHNIIPFALYKINIKTIHMNKLCCVSELKITLVLELFFLMYFCEICEFLLSGENASEIKFPFKKSDNKV